MACTLGDSGERVVLRRPLPSQPRPEPQLFRKPAAFFSLLLRRHFVLQFLPGEVAGGFEGMASHALDLDRPKSFRSRHDVRLMQLLAVKKLGKGGERGENANGQDYHDTGEIE